MTIYRKIMQNLIYFYQINFISHCINLYHEVNLTSINLMSRYSYKFEENNIKISGIKVYVSWNISPPADSKVFHWSEWFRSRTNRGQKLKTLPRRRRYLEFNASIVTLCTCNKIQHANISKPPEYNLLIYVSE